MMLFINIAVVACMVLQFPFQTLFFSSVGCSVSWTPSFLLKRFILTGIRDGPHEPFIADSIDFVVSQVTFYEYKES